MDTVNMDLPLIFLCFLGLYHAVLPANQNKNLSCRRDNFRCVPPKLERKVNSVLLFFHCQYTLTEGHFDFSLIFKSILVLCQFIKKRMW